MASSGSAELVETTARLALVVQPSSKAGKQECTADIDKSSDSSFFALTDEHAATIQVSTSVFN